MDEKIINAIRNNDIAELKEHPLAEAGFNSVVCDALRVIGIITLAELVNCSNMQQLITVIDALPVDDKKAFYSACRRANIKISEEMRTVLRVNANDEKKKFVNGEMLFKYIASITEQNRTAWVKPIKGAESAIALSFLKTLFGKTPSKDDIRSLRCYYSTVTGQAFSEYCLSEFGELGIDLQYKYSSILLIYVSIAYHPSSELESDEFVVYQIYDQESESNTFKGLFAIKNDDKSIEVSIRKNHLYFNNLFNYENTNKLRLTANIIRLSAYIARQKHYLYILEKSNAKSFEIIKARKQLEQLICLHEKITPNLLQSENAEDLLILKEIEDALDRHVTAQDGIDELDFSVRSHNCLTRAGIIKISDLEAKTIDELLKVRNLGRKSLEEVLAVMFAHGFRIKDNPESPVEYKFGSNVADHNIRNHVLDNDGRLVDFFILSNASTLDETVTPEEISESPILTAEDTIDKIDFTVRAFNCLKRRGIETIGELTELTYDELIKTRNLGIRNIVEVIVTMYDKGFRFKDCREEQYHSIEEYLIDKVPNCKERILEAFPDGILNIGMLQSRKLDFNLEDQPDTTNKTELLDAREAQLDKREKELAEKEEALGQVEAKLAEIAKKLQVERDTLDEMVKMLGKKQS